MTQELIEQLVQSNNKRIDELEVHIETQRHLVVRDRTHDYSLVDALEANLQNARELRTKVSSQRGD